MNYPFYRLNSIDLIDLTSFTIDSFCINRNTFYDRLCNKVIIQNGEAYSKERNTYHGYSPRYEFKDIIGGLHNCLLCGKEIPESELITREENAGVSFWHKACFTLWKNGQRNER